MNQGWQCPGCKTIWAPTVQRCVQCSPVTVPCAPLYPQPPYWLPYIAPYRVTPPPWGPITVTCTSTSCEPNTYTVYNDPSVSVFAQ
jgi:hypothetical protein